MLLFCADGTCTDEAVNLWLLLAPSGSLCSLGGVSFGVGGLLFVSHSKALIVRPPVSCRLSSLRGLRFCPGIVHGLNFVHDGLSFSFMVMAGRSKLNAASFPRRAF